MTGGLLILTALLFGAERFGIPEGLSLEEKRHIEIFRRAKRSVVHINTSALRRRFFSLDVGASTAPPIAHPPQDIIATPANIAKISLIFITGFPEFSKANSSRQVLARASPPIHSRERLLPTVQDIEWPAESAGRVETSIVTQKRP